MGGGPSYLDEREVVRLHSRTQVSLSIANTSLADEVHGAIKADTIGGLEFMVEGGERAKS